MELVKLVKKESLQKSCPRWFGPNLTLSVVYSRWISLPCFENIKANISFVFVLFFSFRRLFQYRHKIAEKGGEYSCLDSFFKGSLAFLPW